MRIPKTFHILLLLPFLAGCAWFDSGTPRPDPGKQDAALREAVLDKLHAASPVVYGDIEAAALDGRVLLMGTIPTETDKNRAGEVAQGVPGVASVDNRLELNATGSFNDSVITTKVKSSLLVDTSLNGFAISVETVNGIVYLWGVVHLQSQLDTAVATAGGVADVKRVVSMIRVQPE